MYFSGINPFKVMFKDFDLFWKFFPAAIFRAAFVKFTRNKFRSKIYGGLRIVHNQNKGNEALKGFISSGKPFMFGRFGSNECLIAINGLMKEKGCIEKINCAKWDTACLHSGFFPNVENSYLKYNSLFIDSAQQCDIYGALRFTGEDYYIKHYMIKNLYLTHANTLDFWQYEEPYTYSLKGKKVLVVHYLAEQIKEQYKKRELLFENPKVLPEFELITLPAVQTIAGERDKRFTDWFKALEYMKDEVKKIDFDIALLGCGAYGMPLASEIKKMGKQVIYMGGVLQMLFGIYGKRWDAEPRAKMLKNEYWVDPDPRKKPKNSGTVEDGCYW